MSFLAADLIVDPSEESSGHCECCGHVSRCIWGYVAKDDACVAAYYVRWTVNRLDEHDASLDLILGSWGNEATPDGRFIVSLIFRLREGMFMVIDTPEDRLVSSSIASIGLRRDEVIGTPLATQVFAIVDAIWLQDSRLFSSERLRSAEG